MNNIVKIISCLAFSGILTVGVGANALAAKGLNQYDLKITVKNKTSCFCKDITSGCSTDKKMAAPVLIGNPLGKFFKVQPGQTIEAHTFKGQCTVEPIDQPVIQYHRDVPGNAAQSTKCVTKPGFYYLISIPSPAPPWDKKKFVIIPNLVSQLPSGCN